MLEPTTTFKNPAKRNPLNLHLRLSKHGRELKTINGLHPKPRQLPQEFQNAKR